MSKNKIINLRITDEQLEKCEQYAKKMTMWTGQHITKSHIIRKVIEDMELSDLEKWREMIRTDCL